MTTLAIRLTAHTFFTICTTSSSSRMWSLPTVWGLCFALAPYTIACLKLLIMFL